MFRTTRAVVAILAAAVLSCAPLAARADTADADAFGRLVVAPANESLKEYIAELKVAQARPVGEPEAPIHRPSLPPGASYTIDVSSAWAQGKTGAPSNKLPGGVDIVVGKAFARTFRIQAGYYELQEYPIGFDTGIVPVYLQGVASPVSTVNLNAAPLSLQVKNRLLTVSAQNLFTIGNVRAGKAIPIVISPTYTARWGTIGSYSGDLVTFNDRGLPFTANIRTTELWQLPVTLPFIASRNSFATYTVAPTWLTHLAGVQQTNKAQLLHLLYAETRPVKRVTLFVEPSLLPNYLPNMEYPQHLFTMIYGASYKTSKVTFIQGVVSNGAPMNTNGQIGVTSVTCLVAPTCLTNVNQQAPTITGLHAAQFQLKFGLGSPSVIPL